MSTLIVPTEYPSIQLAVNAADVGDIIEVLAGVYEESVTVSKDDIMIKGNLGAELNGNGDNDAGFIINAEDVTIDGFRIYEFTNGVAIAKDNAKINNCQIVFNHGVGIKIDSDTNRVTNCSIGGNRIAGISLGGSENTIENCTIDSNELAGITSTIAGGTRNTIRLCNFSTSIVAITLLNSATTNTRIESNLIRLVDFGIAVFTNDNSIVNNTILEAKRTAMQIIGSNNELNSNMVVGAEIGISVVTEGNKLVTNNVTDAKTYGISIQGKGNEIISNALVRNNVGIHSLHEENYMRDNEYYDNNKDLIQLCA